MVCGQNSPPYMFCMGLGARSGFYIFLWLGKKSKEQYFMTYEKYMNSI